MSKKIEEAFNDCFDRLLRGESIESCINSYPEYAAELDSMLRITFDVKRRAYPVQPRPEFKYWSRVKLQNIQYYASNKPSEVKTGTFNLRRNLAISMAAILVFVIASSGTAAASSEALPDQPLYGVKLAVEQVQLTLTPSDEDKAELYARLAEKRASEIAAMARVGKDDKVVTTTVRMNYQIEQAERFMQQYEAAKIEAARTTSRSMSATSTTPSPSNTDNASTSSGTLPPVKISPQPALTDKQKEQQTSATRTTNEINKAKTALSASTAKSLAILQDILDKSSDSVRPNLNQIIERTKKANEKFHVQSQTDQDQEPSPPEIKSNTGPINVAPGSLKSDTDKHDPFYSPDKPKHNSSSSSNLSTEDSKSDNSSKQGFTPHGSTDNNQDDNHKTVK